MKSGDIQMSLKNRLGLALLNGGSFMFVFFLVQYFWNGEFHDWTGLIFQGVFFGLGMAFIFPYSFGKLGASLGKNIYPDLEEAEVVETEGLANLFRGMEAVGGKLFMTNERLIFKSHKLNINTGQSGISYQSIIDIKPRKSGKLVDNGLRVTLVDGHEYDFVVANRDTWMEKLQGKLNL